MNRDREPNAPDLATDPAPRHLSFWETATTWHGGHPQLPIVTRARVWAYSVAEARHIAARKIERRGGRVVHVHATHLDYCG